MCCCSSDPFPLSVGLVALESTRQRLSPLSLVPVHSGISRCLWKTSSDLMCRTQAGRQWLTGVAINSEENGFSFCILQRMCAQTERAGSVTLWALTGPPCFPSCSSRWYSVKRKCLAKRSRSQRGSGDYFYETETGTGFWTMPAISNPCEQGYKTWQGCYRYFRSY